jgi:eukaryotic-like serine/threonine-protein kinase
MSEAQTEPCPACGSLLDVTGAHIFAERTCPVCATPINVRRKFGHYELIGMVGSGGQGVVYRAVDNNLNRLVALKLLRTEYSEDPEFVRQFEHEARLTASINHPNVVRVYSFGADEGHVYLAMELVDNGTMDDLMEKLGRIPEARALQIGIEVAQGLRAGYEKGLIHRDVKPGNVLFAKDGTAKVVDYGLAMFFEQAALASGEIWGTPYYLSPERLNRSPEDFRSDIYSLGAALFHAIAGRPPFEAEDASHVALKHLRAQAVSLHAFAPGICNATAYVINRTLAKNPDERQQSYDEFIEQLQFAREEALARARGGGSKQKGRLVLEDAESKKTMSWITIATLVVFVLGLGVGGLLIMKAVRGNKGDPASAPAAAAENSLSDLGPEWAAAQEALADGSYNLAAQTFQEAAAKQPAGSNERAVAIVHRALALQFAGKHEQAAAALAELDGFGTQMSKFFAEVVAPKLRNGDPIPPTATRDLDTRSFEGAATLFYALKNHELGRLEEAGQLFRQFASYSPGPSSSWVADLKRVSRPFQDDLDEYALASNAWATARTSQERDQAYQKIEALVKRLKPENKLQGSAKQLLAQAEKRRADDLAARSKANFAFRAKVQANGADPGMEAEKAVDGDPRTRWTLNRPGEKWLAVDLGSAKEISRWVVRGSGEKWDLNTTEIKFQRSEDGKIWQDVDSLTNSTRDVVDRVVVPFTARHVRVVSTRGGMKQGDNGFRVAEFEVGSAADQAKAEYDPNKTAGIRVSTKTDLLFGPIGDPFAQGSLKLDEGTGKYTMKAAGADIWGTMDHFHFAWQPMEGDCDVVARITHLQRVHEWTKAGVMIRAALNKESAFGMSTCGPDGKMQFAKRLTNSGKTEAPLKTALPLPCWVKIERRGTTLIGYESADGQKWNEIGRDTLRDLPKTAFVGFAATSHVSGTLAEVQFDNVTITKK